LNAALEARIRERLGTFIFGTDDQSYEAVLASRLRGAGLTLCVAETAFGSSIIQTLKLMEGSAQFLRLGLTLLGPEAAQKILSVPAALWRDESAINIELTKALAEGVRRLGGSDLGLGITVTSPREGAGPSDLHRPGPWNGDGMHRAALAFGHAVHRKPYDQDGPVQVWKHVASLDLQR